MVAFGCSINSKGTLILYDGNSTNDYDYSSAQYEIYVQQTKYKLYSVKQKIEIINKVNSEMRLSVSFASIS